VCSRTWLFGSSSPAVFIVWSRRSQSVLRPTSKPVVRCQPWFYLRLVAYSFFGCPRGPRVGCETGCPRHAAPNFSVETHSRTECLKNPTDHRLESFQGMERTPETLKLFVVSDVGASEADSFLPDDQCDRCNLRASVRRAISVGFPWPLEPRKLLKRASLGGRDNAAPLKMFLSS